MNSIQEIIEKAGMLNDTFQYKEAYILLSKHLDKEIKYSSFYLYFARCAYELGYLDKAEAKLFEGIDILNNSSDVEASELIWFYHELAMVHLKREKIDASFEYCYKSIRLALTHPYKRVQAGIEIKSEFAFEIIAPQLLTLAVLFQIQNKFEDAYKLLAMIKIYAERKYDLDSLSSVCNELGLVCFELNKPYEGIINLKKSILYKQLIKKNSAHTYNNLIFLLEKNKENINLEFVKALFES